jgi:phosphoribosylformylglycinamidine synthase
MGLRVAILFTAGTNCDQETKHALELAGAQVELVHINLLRAGERRLKDYQLLVLPGGFTYGDYIAAGRILANELRSILKDELMDFIQLGFPILGICNGFQVLAKAGILPGFDAPFSEPVVTLDANDSGRFEDRWVYLKPLSTPCIFTKGIDALFELPVAHAEGKFLVKDDGILRRLREHNQVVLEYSTPAGGRADYPYNPNGSVEGIAGICDPTGRIFGLMPHPERFISPFQHPLWTRKKVEPIGLKTFKNAVEYIKSL